LQDVNNYEEHTNSLQRRWTFLWMGILVVMLQACIPQSGPENGVPIAQVGDQTLYLQQVKQNLPDFVYQQDSVKAILNFRSDWIEQQVLYQEAMRLGLEDQARVQQQLAKMRRDVLTNALRNSVLGKNEEDLEITRQEAQNYYEANKRQFVLDEPYVRFRHLKTSNLSHARQAKAALMRGESWPDVVDEYGEDKQETIRNSTQFWPLSTAAKDIDPMNRYLEIIGITEISPIRLVNGQYHFVQLMERRAKGEHPDIEWLLTQIQDWLRLEKRRKYYRSYVKNLYLNAQANNEIKEFDLGLNPSNTGNTSSSQTSNESPDSN
jgi:hypothetical protein